MPNRKKIKWMELNRKGRALPILLIHTAANGMRKYFTKYHDGKTRITHYRQAMGGRGFSVPVFNAYLKMIQQNEKKIDVWMRAWKRRFDAVMDLATAIGRMPLDKKTDAELKKIYYRFYDLYSRATCYAYDYRIVGLHYPGVIQSFIARRISSAPQLNQYMEMIFSLSAPIELHREEIKMLELTLKVKSGLSVKATATALKRHANRFGFLGMYLYYGEPYTIEHFRKELNRLKRLSRKKLESRKSKITQRFRDNQAAVQKMITDLELTPREAKLIERVRLALNLSMECDEYYSMIGFRIRPFLMELCRRFGLAYKQLIEMTNDEVFSLFQKPLSAKTLSEINQRYEDAVLILQGQTIRVLTGPKMTEYVKPEIKKMERLKKKKELSGETGYPGTVTGTVQIIREVTDIKTFQQGHILVTGSTAPQYVPAMKKAKAIITDEGGLLSHAAIMSREFKTPCIIGTKLATQILNNGDRVHVDAERGTIKRI